MIISLLLNLLNIIKIIKICSVFHIFMDRWKKPLDCYQLYCNELFILYKVFIAEGLKLNIIVNGDYSLMFTKDKVLSILWYKDIQLQSNSTIIGLN
jgi:hypothetical protein